MDQFGCGTLNGEVYYGRWRLSSFFGVDEVNCMAVFVLVGNVYSFFTGARLLDRAKVFGVWRVVCGVQDAFQKICTFRGVCSGADVWPCG